MSAAISLRARLLRFFAERQFRHISPDSDVNELRERFEKVAGRLRVPRGIRIRQTTTAGVDCDWLLPQGCDRAPLLFFLHGGAYLMGSRRTHRHLVATIAQAAGVRAVLPDYRLAPEHPFPAAIDDACRVYRELLGQGEPPARIVIGGDSAGGGLTMATLQSLRDDGEPLPAAAVLLSPWLDLSASGESMQTRLAVEPFFRPADMPAVARMYCKPGEIREPRVSPVFADVAGLPPVFIQVGDHEILLSDSTRIRDKLAAAGGRVTLQVWPGMWHVFQFFVGLMPEAAAAIDDIGMYIRGVFGSAAGRRRQ